MIKRKIMKLGDTCQLYNIFKLVCTSKIYTLNFKGKMKIIFLLFGEIKRSENPLMFSHMSKISCNYNNVNFIYRFTILSLVLILAINFILKIEIN